VIKLPSTKQTDIGSGSFHTPYAAMMTSFSAGYAVHVFSFNAPAPVRINYPWQIEAMGLFMNYHCNGCLVWDGNFSLN
jgi:hypothetical protein